MTRTKMQFENKMDILQIAEYCWSNRMKFSFGNLDVWDGNTFLKGWFTQQSTDYWFVGGKCHGWYWFELDISAEDLAKVEKPSYLPGGACDFGETAVTNLHLFGDYLCHYKSKIPVIYNGHESNVYSRIRSHFAVNNEKTGALAINRYPLSNRRWQASIFIKT